jgi:MT0933-like antitoxin protein
MGFMDKIKGMFGQNKDQATGAVEKTGDAVDDKTGGKYSSQVDTAQAKADEFIDKTKDEA